MDRSTALQRPESALILLGHGSTVNPDSSAPTLLHADEIKRRGVFGEVVCAFWKEEPSFRQVLDMVESPEVYIVPNFISEGYFTQKIIPREIGLRGPVTHLPARPGLPARTLKYCEPVGSHARMTDLLLHRAREVAPGVDPREAALVIVGHGTSLNENSGLAVKEQVARIQGRGEYAEVRGMFMEEDPFVTDWQKLTTAPHVIVVPFFVSDGLHSYQDIPVLLGIAAEPGGAASSAEVFRHNPYPIGGRRLYYSSAVGTDPLFASVILDQVLHFDAQHPPGLHRGLSRSISQALAAWLAAGENRIGELLITGEYELRHHLDTGLNGLATYDDSKAARDIALYDAGGNYRPLKTAPTLRRGWRITLTTIEQLRDALDCFYPAMLAARLAYQQGRLAITPLRDTLNRQSGMYAVTKKISDAQADALIGAFCRSDGGCPGCLKTLLWAIAPGLPITSLPKEKLDPPSSFNLHTSSFPLLCAEACNLLVAAAREVVKKPPTAAQ